jgi:hypothetical protein
LLSPLCNLYTWKFNFEQSIQDKIVVLLGTSWGTHWEFDETPTDGTLVGTTKQLCWLNNVKHVSTKGSFLKYFWHLRFFSWHTIKTLTSFKLFWMIKCIRKWMIKCTRGCMKYNLVCNYLFQLG